MKTGITLLCVFGLGLIFDYWKVGNDPEFHYLFPLSKQPVTYQYWVWAILEKVGFLIVLYLWYREASEYSRPYVLMFLFLMLGEFVDYVFTYSEYEYLGITYNKWFVMLYTGFIIYHAWKDR